MIDLVNFNLSIWRLTASGLTSRAGKMLNLTKEVKARTVREVLGEVLKNGFCNHIQEPEAPGVLYGDLNNIEADCKTYHQNKNIDKNGKAKALRSDANVLIAGVVSLEGIRENYDDWDKYKTDVVGYLKEKYGDNLAAVVEHRRRKPTFTLLHCAQGRAKIR